MAADKETPRRTDRTVPAATGAQPASTQATPAGPPADARTADAPTTDAGKPRRPRPSVDVAQVRTWIAQAVWLVFLVAATALAVAALCIAVDANQQNGLVSFVLDLAQRVDLGVFTLDDGIMHFTGENAETKNALVNYGIGAVVYLLVGRLVERVIRP